MIQVLSPDLQEVRIKNLEKQTTLTNKKYQDNIKFKKLRNG